jgi:uncharacterized LabA/DUF88 family protein
VSKNVAVFVDVANIFYAAKAAGVDIDYVTLLKSAIAGRDFVRAYAYTGLDPDNENQRQFHSFLARHGYKVVSKDIRKYGDGRIKANLDIELVVDMMRLARNLDIAVVVSGDGDFAPAIRAVQQTGVRVEVISFRGNTSSDLIEVADSFTDIAQIARVDKASARSGRRVAAEGDLSMTEVPEKETEGVPRRQRGRRSERAAAAAGDGASNLIVLPGERLSRVGEEDEPVEQPTIVAAGDAEVERDEEASLEAAADGGEEGRRRRRRRGGRGRGRGRRAEGDVLPAGQAAADEEEEEDFDEVAPAPLPQHTFGSVWDSQLGVPSTLPTASAEPPDDEDEDFEEPEIPEYLLAERRQRGQRRGRMGGGRQRAGYQAALDRERFGRSGVSGGFTAGGGRAGDRQRGDRQRGRQQQRPPRGDRQPQQRPADRSAGTAPQASASTAPWSEVPPELEELLLAELARKGPAPEAADAGTVAEGAPAESDGEGQTDADATADEKPKRTTRRRTTKATAESDAGDGEGAGAADEKPKRTTRRRTTKAAAESDAEGQADADGAADEKPKRTTRRRTTKAAAESDAGDGEGAG